MKIEVKKVWSAKDQEFRYEVYQNGEFLTLRFNEKAAIEIAEQIQLPAPPDEVVWSKEI